MWREQLLSRRLLRSKEIYNFFFLSKAGNRTPCPVPLWRWSAMRGRWGQHTAANRFAWPINCNLSTSCLLLSGLKGFFTVFPGLFFSRDLTDPGSKLELRARKKSHSTHPHDSPLLWQKILLSRSIGRRTCSALCLCKLCLACGQSPALRSSVFCVLELGIWPLELQSLYTHRCAHAHTQLPSSILF